MSWFEKMRSLPQEYPIAFSAALVLFCIAVFTPDVNAQDSMDQKYEEVLDRVFPVPKTIDRNVTFVITCRIRPPWEPEVQFQVIQLESGEIVINRWSLPEGAESIYVRMSNADLILLDPAAERLGGEDWRGLSVTEMATKAKVRLKSFRVHYSQLRPLLQELERIAIPAKLPTGIWGLDLVRFDYWYRSSMSAQHAVLFGMYKSSKYNKVALINWLMRLDAKIRQLQRTEL
jgi:hypothetical protein